MNKFVFMHKNTPVANISIQKDENGNGYLHVESIINRNELPYGLKNENLERMSISMTWWNNSRCIPMGRPNYDKLLDSLGVANTSEIVPYSYMCSLTDCYWFKQSGSHISWEDVNFRDNGFASNLYKHLFYNYSGEPVNNLNSPDITTDGAIPKMWIEKDGEFYLVKSSLGKVPMDVYNEIIANEILKQMEIPHVEYFIGEFDNIKASVCPCFIKSDTYEFVQAENLVSDGYYNTPNDYLNAMREFGFKSDIDAMILIDMIIGNVDRHARNYGQIIDTNTQGIICAAPIFDNGGCDLLHDVSRTKYKPTGLTFAETLKTLSEETLSLSNKIDLECLGKFIDSFQIDEQNKIRIKENLNNRISHIIELSRGIDYDFDRER